MEKRKLLLIINPRSGKEKASKLRDDIIRRFEDANFSVQLMETQKKGDAVDFAKMATSNQLVVCVGGDGTLHEVLNGIMQSGNGATLGYIPMGSVNDFALSVGIPRNYKKAINCIVNGTEQNIDVCKFNDEYFSYIAAAGLFTKASYSTSQKLKNKIGKIAYLLFGIKKLVIERAMKFDDFVLDIANDVLLIYFFTFGTIAVGGLPTPRNKHGYAISVNVAR